MSPCYLLHGLVSFFVIANNVSRSAWVSRTLYCFSLIVLSPPRESISFYSRLFRKVCLLVRDFGIIGFIDVFVQSIQLTDISAYLFPGRVHICEIYGGAFGNTLYWQMFDNLHN